MFRLRTLGSVDLRDDAGNELSSVLAQPKRLALLVYLAAARPAGVHRRDKLLALLWPDLDDARSRDALNQSLTFLRQALGAETLVRRGADEIGIDSARIWCDAVAVREALDDERPSDALDLYRGDFLQGFFVEAGSGFDEWVESERSALRERAAFGARQLASWHEEAGRFTMAIDWARRALDLVPDDERTLRRVLTLYERAGDRAGALHLYIAFVHRLRSEYECDPSPETAALIDRVRAAGHVSLTRASPRPEASRYVPRALGVESTDFTTRYRIERELGRGGMATVYLAHDLKHDREVAVKVLLPQIAEGLARERFAREIRIASRLQHPNIVPLFDSGETDGRLYYVMPHVEGETLRERLSRGRLPIDDVVRVLREMASALSYAHGRGVVHRDLKPENILLIDQRAVLADFGIARAAHEAWTPGGAIGPSRETLTQLGISLGTPAYMAPEQAAGSLNIDHRADLYALGVVGYEMLTGRPPFSGALPQQVLAAQIAVAPVPVTELRVDTPVSLGALVMRCLEKDPQARLQSAGELLSQLRAHDVAPTADSPAVVSAGVTEDGIPKINLQPPGARRRLRMRVVAIPALAVTVGVVVGMFAWPGRDTTPAHTIVADVEGSAELDVRRTVRSLLGAALDQAPLLVPIPDADIREGLARMMRPSTQPLDSATALELAYRGSVRTVIVPVLDQAGETFALTIRVIDVETGTLLAIERAVSKSEDELIPSADDVVRRLHRRLGGRRAELRAAREMQEATTASFEAYKKVEQARELRRALQVPEAITLLHEALALDSGYSVAWDDLAVTWSNLGERDSVLAAAEQLERHLERGSARERLRHRAAIAMARSDYATDLQLLDRYIREYRPDDPGWVTTRGLVLAALGRHEEAVLATRRGLEGARFGPRQSWVRNLVQFLSILGRPRQARDVADSIRKECGAACAQWLADSAWQVRFAIALDEWDRSEKLVAGMPGSRWFAASLLSRRGSLSAAWAALNPDGRPRGADQGSAVAELLYTMVSERPWTEPPAFAMRKGAQGAAWKGVWEAIAGDTTVARQLAAEVRAAFPGPFRGAAPEFIEAAVAARDHRWRSVVNALGPAAANGEWGRPQYDAWITPLPIRWLVATAYERLGNLDSATTMYERVLWPGGSFIDVGALRGIPYSFAHQRLSVLYARMGRVEDAKRHWKIFRAAFTNPDPDLRKLVADADRAVKEPAIGGRVSGSNTLPGANGATRSVLVTDFGSAPNDSVLARLSAEAVRIGLELSDAVHVANALHAFEELAVREGSPRNNLAWGLLFRRDVARGSGSGAHAT